MNHAYNDRFVAQIEPEFNTFMARAEEIRWSPRAVPFEKIDRSKLTIADVFGVFVTLHIENYSDVYTRLLTTSYDNVPLVKNFVLNWEKEEENHARTLEAYLVALGIPLEELKANYAKVDKSDFPEPSRDQTELNVFVFLQELFTREMYSKMLKAAKEPVLRDILKRVVRDEERHFRFYKQSLALRMQLDPKDTLRAVKRIFKIFGMPQTMYRQSAMTDKLMEYFPYKSDEIMSIVKPIAQMIEQPPSRLLAKTPRLQWLWQNRLMFKYSLQSRYLRSHAINNLRDWLGVGKVKAKDKEYVERSVQRLETLLVVADEPKLAALH